MISLKPENKQRHTVISEKNLVCSECNSVRVQLDILKIIEKDLNLNFLSLQSYSRKFVCCVITLLVRMIFFKTGSVHTLMHCTLVSNY